MWQAVGTKVFSVIAFFTIAAEQDAVEVVKRQRCDVGLELSTLDHTHTTCTERLHTIAELGHQLSHGDQRRFYWRTQCHPTNNNWCYCPYYRTNLVNWDINFLTEISADFIGELSVTLQTTTGVTVLITGQIW